MIVMGRRDNMKIGENTMSTSMIVCAGKNASSRSDSANALYGETSAVVIEAADAASLRMQLQPYRTERQLRVMLQYFHTPDRTILSNPGYWWDEVSNKIGRSAPVISSRASAKANINKDTGGGFLQFCWESISPDELESYCRLLDNTL
jgi:hypothetical protein